MERLAWFSLLIFVGMFFLEYAAFAERGHHRSDYSDAELEHGDSYDYGGHGKEGRRVNKFVAPKKSSGGNTAVRQVHGHQQGFKGTAGGKRNRG